MLQSVEYLGHKISGKGLQPTDYKIRAIQNAPSPKDITQLKSFLGLLNYYAKFLPDLSSSLSPLYTLLQKDTPWTWGPAQDKAFKDAKARLTSDCLLVHYDPTKDLVLACDASPYGIGAVLSHRDKDGVERPVAFASRSLAPAEKNYSQVEKEGLAIIFGVKKFHLYLFGRHFQILSDHKPLKHMLDANKGTPTVASSRLQRWSIILSAYDYSLQYKPGPTHCNADLLSRLPVDLAPRDIPEPAEYVLLMETLSTTPLTARQIKDWSRKDPDISRVIDYVLRGWKTSDAEVLKPFRERREELTVKDGCLLWGSRVVIPKAGRQQALELFHEGHPGVSRMKSLARSYIWWPGLDTEIEKKVKNCCSCQQNRNCPPPAPLVPWEFPNHPWQRLHADFAGPYEGKMFFVLVDAHSKWLEVIPMSTTTSEKTIETLRTIFATHGLPEVFVTDNGPQFTSSEFRNFMDKNGIRHLRSAPYHPATNGLAERAVQTFKRSMEKNTEGSLSTRIARILFQYRRTPHTTTGVSPAELLLKRVPRSHFDLLKPELRSRVQDKQMTQQQYHDSHAKQRDLAVGDEVFIKDLPNGKDWIPGVIHSTEGPRSFQVTLTDGRRVRRHLDHIRKRSAALPDSSPQREDFPDYPLTSTTVTEAVPEVEVSVSEDTTNLQQPRRSVRNIQPPDYLRYGRDFELRREEL